MRTTIFNIIKTTLAIRTTVVADKAAYQHDCHADKWRYRHDMNMKCTVNQNHDLFHIYEGELAYFSQFYFKCYNVKTPF